MAYLNSILQLPMALLLLAQLLVMVTAGGHQRRHNLAAPWHDVRCTSPLLAATLLSCMALAIWRMLMFPIAGWTWFALAAAVTASACNHRGSQQT